MKKQFLRLVAVAVTFTLILNLVGLNFGVISADSTTKTKTWTFDSENDLNDFESYYYSKATGYVKDDSISQSFNHSNG
ncbi:MAG: hypothetical protein J6J13_02350 [Clostridia bacterium]|nr:hypothetical protein [Clostridia bacterium]